LRALTRISPVDSRAALGGAVVTGAGRGLGFELARTLADRGYTVHITDVDGSAAQEAARRLGEPVLSSRLDVADPVACEGVARSTIERAGSLRVWVNCAGILPTGHGWDNDEHQRRLAFDVNAHGTINGTLAALDVMRDAGSGHIINIVSLAGLVAAPGETLYAATKHAALAFSVGVYLDLRRDGVRDIHVSAVCPDGIWTPMLYDKVHDPEAALSWSGVMLAPVDVARRAVALLDRPRPVLSIPRWRGGFVRVFAMFPGVGARLLPLVFADARRKQRAWARRH
jgi:NAD(P)-dependent dehydrogenase (short-subunit alcohol dehydrogenase family)